MPDLNWDIPLLLDEIASEPPYRVEYVEGGMTVEWLQSHWHHAIVDDVAYALVQAGANVFTSRVGYCGRIGCGDPRIGNHVLPDLTVLARDFTRAEITAGEAHGNWMTCEPVALAAEVTGTRPSDDTGTKLTAYARTSIPHYLLVDRTEHTVTLYSDPTGDVDVPAYGTMHTVKFGEPVPMPDGYPTLDSTTWQ